MRQKKMENFGKKINRKKRNKIFRLQPLLKMF